ncbi:MAG: hypothetical protein V7K67_19595 [Nostoc sp.]
MITNFIYAGHGGKNFSGIWRSHHAKGQYRDISGILSILYLKIGRNSIP